MKLARNSLHSAAFWMTLSMTCTRVYKLTNKTAVKDLFKFKNIIIIPKFSNLTL